MLIPLPVIEAAGIGIFAMPIGAPCDVVGGGFGIMLFCAPSIGAIGGVIGLNGLPIGAVGGMGIAPPYPICALLVFVEPLPLLLLLDTGVLPKPLLVAVDD